MDQKLSAVNAAVRFEVARRILDSGRKMTDSPMYPREEGPSIVRCETMKSLLNLPWQAPAGGGLKCDAALPVLVRMLGSDDCSDSLRKAGQTALQCIGNVHKHLLVGHVKDVFALIRRGGNDALLSLCNAELYNSDPEAVHANVDVLFNHPFASTCAMLYAISQKDPQPLVAYYPQLRDATLSETTFAAMGINIIKAVAKAAPATVHPDARKLMDFGMSTPHCDTMLPGVLRYYMCSACS